MHVLLVEDDEIIRERLEAGLRKHGYDVTIAVDGEQGVWEGLRDVFAVILLDLMLPKKDGIEVCRELRESGINAPILMLTARDAISDRVLGLDAGADDYLPKPFSFQELLARIRALTRRDSRSKTAEIRLADLTIDTTGHIVRRAGEEILLTKREFALLEALARNAGRVLTRDVILDRVWGDDQSISNTIEFHMSSLRKKIDSGRDQKLIHTVHGVGYSMRVPD